MRRNQPAVHRGRNREFYDSVRSSVWGAAKSKEFSGRPTMPGEIEQIRELPRRAVRVPRVGQPGVRIPKFVEEWVAHRFNC